MNITIPIKQLPSEKDEHGNGNGVWGRKCHFDSAYPALEFWGRHDYFLELHHPNKYSNIPSAVQLGHGDMHLDYWVEPDQLIGTAQGGDHDDDDDDVVVNIERKPIFEVMLNVSDYKPEELKVRLSEDRLLTIEGMHEGRDRHSHLDSIYASFKRSVTLPIAVIDRQIECHLTSDGEQLFVTAPVLPRPTSTSPSSRVTRYHNCSEARGQCPNLTQCDCMIAEDRRGSRYGTT